MSFYDVRKGLPFRLAFKPKSAASPFGDALNAYDVAISGIPFLLKIDKENPLTRSTAQFRKQQLDTSLEPGEQSLSGWWLRSQSSFHYGAGIKYGDPELDETAAFRFTSSEGVNPWIPGQVSLLPTTTLIKAASGPVKVITGLSGGVEKYYRVDGADVWQGDASGTETKVYDGSATILDITTDGSDVYFATADDIMVIPGGSGTASQKWDLTAASSVVIGWVKQRLVAGINNSIYIPAFGSAILPAAVYSHPNASWRWTDIAEGPEAIYISGGVGSESVIIRLALDATGAVPTLTNATVVAQFPTGETVQSMHAYLGTYLGIGTSKGVRVAVMGTGGALQYGPLVDTPASVKCVTARGNGFLCGYSDGFTDGTSGLLRVELRSQFPNGAFPYATDLQSHAVGSVDSVAILPTSGLAIFGVTDSGVYREHPTDLETTGWLLTGRHRFGTVWPKLFKRFNVRGDFTGPMTVSTVDEDGNETSLISLTSGSDQSLDLAINYPSTPQEFLSLKFTLNRASDHTQGTVFRSYQLKSLPGGPRPRQFTIPLMCFDYERDRNEVTHGWTGFAMERLEALEALDSSGDAVLFQDLGSNTAILCTIEAMEYRQVDARGTNGSRWGGVLTVALRTLSS
ncbi:hypothetical protein AB0C33_01850 [Nonomuraea sp. NPDC048881]|uniref:hypothetical protein n=1 Tax=Nonomuraea sp. NPDC048881 TaxID=3155030 RepID=UPI0033C7075C